ncbi:FAD-dependent oxidoreductase [Pseudoalteromonas sp. SR43-6]|uniref:FAD-dependent oxidoreductase n=1 Tax=Pseudoalteromonas TaxID=53246 RepID=UPI0015F92559|nr:MULTISPECIES: FAD-dependent oxidoreductase [Pseudoalteromonas]MBB1288466.1 FAD-dependent oxidoreductase [Pseudoalteromonas sp. SR41-5]MBB1373876.1 FAD-dependent oxidoreductase [Pseudoalteromonas sp. SR43-6]MBB1376547.1 FAD-dependent oxidoreductase [Pseudoalteromonas sp. SR43-2]MBB1412927.1 FAD-dependent oxidoreductase [Pseudoalteromonas sp. SG43-8]MBD0412834.1 FAD-dependent oxidoreductase [Pseudoalteromonas distincta]
MFYNIAVVGFGLAGRLAALELSKLHHVTVFEADDEQTPNSAGKVAAAMLAPLAESVLCEADLALMGLDSMKRWPEIVSELEGDVFFQQQGTLVVAHQQDKGDLQSFTQRIKPIAGQSAQALNAQQIAQLEPELANRFNQGLFLPCEGQIDNQAFYKASFTMLNKRKVKCVFNQRVTIKNGEINNRPFDYIIDCRGLGAKSDKPLRGVRGEVARLYAPEVNLTRPVRLMHPRYPIYIAPKPNHEYVIGATEIESQDSGAATVRSTLELLSAAYTVHSGFAEARLLNIQTGLRPAFSDNRPEVSQVGNVISINGLYRHGYMLAPALVAQVVSRIE